VRPAAGGGAAGREVLDSSDSLASFDAKAAGKPPADDRDWRSRTDQAPPREVRRAREP